MLLPPGVRRVAHDREQPGTTLTARRTPESVEVLECAQVGLLHDILRVVVVPHQVMRQRVRGIHVRQHDRFESLELVRLQPVLEVRNTPSAKRPRGTPDYSRGNRCEPCEVSGTNETASHPCRRNIDRKSTRLNSSHLVISYAV